MSFRSKSPVGAVLGATRAKTCENIRPSLVAYGRGELSELERQRLAAHLEGCAACAALGSELDGALGAARAFEPSLDPETFAALNSRLRVYTQGARRPRTAWLLVWSGGVALAASVAVVSLWPGVTRRAEVEALADSRGSTGAPRTDSGLGSPQADSGFNAEIARTALGSGPVRGEVVEPQDSPTRRLTPTPFIHIVASAEWDGVVDGAGRQVAVTMSRGAAAFAFVGGEGRRLRVVAPDLQVEVVGTRFTVEAREGQATVRVQEGKVRVLTLAGVLLLGPGEASRDAAEGTDAATAANLAADGELVRFHDEGQANAKRRASRGSGAATDPVSILEEAEALARAGKAAQAVERYEVCAKGRGSLAPFRDLCTYEMARLIGLDLGKIRDARILVGKLVARGGEAAAQARLLDCELALRRDPCGARSCLGRIVRDEVADLELRRDARRLERLWGLETRAECGAEGP